MNRQPLYLLLLCIVVSALACTTRHSEPLTGETVDKNDVHVASGQVLYMQYCYKCHPGGEAGLGPEVVHKPGFARRFQARHGLGVMPSFKKDEIGKQELKDIMAYLNDLHGRKPKDM
jgi:mono/diheme cytochrome c family protein